MVPIPHAAVMHALARDAWPALTRCVSPPPRVRGYANVTLREIRGGYDVRFDGAPLAGDTPLARCVRRAVSAVVLPPRDGSDAEATIAFDLVFNMPSVVVPRRPQAPAPRAPAARPAAPSVGARGTARPSR